MIEIESLAADRLAVSTIWMLGVPEQWRGFVTSALPGYDVRYTTIKQKLSDQLFRIYTDGSHLVARWPGAGTPDLQEFFDEHEIGLATVELIPLNFHGIGGREFGAHVGIRLRKERTRFGAWHLNGEAVMASDASELLALYLENVDGAANAAPGPVMRLSRQPQTALVVLAQSPVDAQSQQADADAQLAGLSAAYVSSGFAKSAVLATVGVTDPVSVIGRTASKSITVVEESFEPGWLEHAKSVVTNDLRTARECALRGIEVKKLTAAGVTDWDLGASEALAVFAEEYLLNCFYSSPVDQSPLSFQRALDLVFDKKQEFLFGLPSKVTKKLPDGSLPRAANFVTAPTGVTVFDNRAKGGLLTCILPYRFSPDRPDALERLRYAEMDDARPAEVEFLVVDDGSDEDAATRVRQLCREMGYSYVYVDTQEKVFSVGRCRNVGAQYSSTRFIFMQDIDLIPYSGFYADLCREIEVQGMLRDAKHFMMVPYVFLTRNGTELFRRTDASARRQTFIHAAITADTGLVEKFSTGTSANVYNRHWYLTRGGNDASFEGWGYEDLEFNTRAIRHLKFFPFPREWSKEKFNFNSVSEFATYKSVYRLFGDMMMMKGIALFHAWHPVNQKSGYGDKESDNRALFINKLENFPRNNIEPLPLADKTRGRSLIFRQNAFTCARLVAPAWGDLILVPDEDVFSTQQLFTDFVAAHDLRRVIFFNPYQTPQMRRIYEWVRSAGIEYVVCERGALPDSSFFDKNGFLADSATYTQDKWDKPLTAPQMRSVEEYISNFRSEKPHLENQPEPIGGRALRAKLGISESERVIFVALQRPGDTVTRFFHRNVTYPQYVEQVRDLCSRFHPDIRVLVKTHPLEDPDGDWGHALRVDDANVYDLIEASDLVWTFNSGVGILAMLWRRAVALSGLAFYHGEGVNHCVDSVEDVLDLLAKDQVPEWDQIHRFIHYLVNDVYSFGTHMTKPVKLPDGSNMTATTDIVYSTLRLDGEVNAFSNREKAICSWPSVLFDRYRYAEQNKRTTPSAE